MRLLARGLARLARTWRVIGVDEGDRTFPMDDFAWPAALYAISERDVLACSRFAFRRSLLTLIAPGRDGDWAATTMEAAGGEVLRGAAGRRGYEGALALVHELRHAPRPAAVVVDGPLGPAGVVKPGVVTVAARTGLSIRPAAAAATRCLTFPATWSGIYLPLPFTSIAYGLGPVITASPAREERDRLTERVSMELGRARTRAQRALDSIGPR